jgi:hypothetical protein
VLLGGGLILLATLLAALPARREPARVP